MQGKRMKFNRLARTVLAGSVSAALGLGTTSCSRDYIAAYVYAISASTGGISAFGVDSQTGILTQISGSPFATQLQNPSTLVATANGKFVYAVGGSLNSEVEEFAVGTDGKLFAQHTYSITGTIPTAAALDSTGTYLYVTFKYQSGFTNVSPGPGGITIFPVNTDNSLGTPVSVNGLSYIPVGSNPVAIAVAASTCTPTPVIPSNTACTGNQGAGHTNNFVYVVDQEASPNATVLGFAQNTSTGALSLLSGTTFNTTLKTYQGARAGVTPSAIAVDPAARYVYVTDKTSNQILGYAISSGTTGNLTALVSSPFSTGLFPVALTIDPRGKYLYTANYNAATVGAYSLNAADGSLGGAAGSSNFNTATGPTCVTIEPALGIYLYTSDYLNGSVSAAQLSPNTGQLSAVANTPYNASGQLSCAVAVANGEHASSIVNP